MIRPELPPRRGRFSNFCGNPEIFELLRAGLRSLILSPLLALILEQPGETGVGVVDSSRTLKYPDEYHEWAIRTTEPKLRTGTQRQQPQLSRRGRA